MAQFILPVSKCISIQARLAGPGDFARNASKRAQSASNYFGRAADRMGPAGSGMCGGPPPRATSPTVDSLVVGHCVCERVHAHLHDVIRPQVL